MLLGLSIRDLALIESLELELGAGLNVVTGETGAGKSLIVGALELLRGETPRGGAKQWVRRGAKEARVEGCFEIRGETALQACLARLRDEVPAVAEALAGEIADGAAELYLGRSLSAEGRTRAHIQQRPVPVRALRALAPLVLEIHGQNDHQALLVPAEQLRLLDQFGRLDETKGRYLEARARWRELRERFERLRAERGDRRDRADLLRFQLGELRGAQLEEGELARLREERELLRVAADVRGELGGWAHELGEGDEALVDRVRAAVVAVERWADRLPSLAAPLEDLRAAEIHVAEAAAGLASLVDGVADDPHRLEVVEERLAELERLAAKYGCDEAGMTALADEQEKELAELESTEEGLDALEGEIERARARLGEAAAALREEREALVPRVRRGVRATLKALGLEKARFDVHFTPRAPEGADLEFGPHGTHDTEFRLAANPGEKPGALRDVASGGEAARIMLALRSILQSRTGGAGADGARTLVFDEIDAGVGGRLGPEVAAQLAKLAARGQVLCVTHIPAIAAAADLHLGTAKEVRKGRTRTLIAPLDGDERVREVADMIAGGSAHESARAEARRLLETSAR